VGHTIMDCSHNTQWQVTSKCADVGSELTVCVLAGVAAHAAALPVVGAHQAAVAELARVATPRILRGVRKGARAPVVLQNNMRRYANHFAHADCNVCDGRNAHTELQPARSCF
jgi:hypothetical protein